MNRLLSKIWRYPAVCLLVALPLSAVHAEAGKVLFVYGKAYVVSADGSRAALEKGSTVESGDTVLTSANGRVQLRMDDGGLLALRPQTEFVIEAFEYKSDGSTSVTGTSGERSFFALVKGGFRSITGAIGKADKSRYRVRTPVATIGIRGTDYTAVYCAANCSGDVAEGLYVGVTDGGVTLRNDRGSLDLDAGQFGQVRSADSTPEKSATAARLLAAEVAPDATESEATGNAVEVAAVAEEGNQEVNLTGGVASESGGAVAYAAGPLGDESGVTGVVAQGASARVSDADGNTVSFETTSPLGVTTFEQNGSQSANLGRDSGREGATGLQWGRWSTGTVDVISPGGTVSQNVDNSSLHWVSAPDGTARVELPSEGTASFALIGNTNPTDNHGNVGTLGSASLAADFTNQTADADVSLSFDQTRQVWDAAARDVDINSDATFGGDFDSVTVTDSVSGQTASGDGDLSGFFSGDADGNLNGAGMSYSLEQGDDVVSGAAAFQVDDSR